MLEKIRNAFLNAFLPLRRSLSRWIKGSFLGTMFDVYHPERHYMRGSGPKSRTPHSDHTADSRQG
jgi:hypothetical protein